MLIRSCMGRSIAQGIMCRDDFKNQMEREVVFYRLILTSKGLNTNLGKGLIGKLLKAESVESKRIFLVTLPVYEVDDVIIESCTEIGFRLENIYMGTDFDGKDFSDIPDVDYIYVTDGNVFELAQWLRQSGLGDYCKKMMDRGATYIGASAGAVLASGRDFWIANFFEANYLPLIRNYTALGLMPESDTCIPHHTYGQLCDFLQELSSDALLKKYTHIYNISDDEALIMDCEQMKEIVKLVAMKRVKG